MPTQTTNAFAVVPSHQLGYLRTVCAAASRAAAGAQDAAARARLELADASGGVTPAQLQHVWRLQREAIQKLNIVLFFGQLYVAAFRRQSPRGPTLGWDDGAD